jgi:hypothetical protein
VILWGSTGGGVSKGHYTENVHKTLSRLALRSFCSLKSFFFIRRGRSYHYAQLDEIYRSVYYLNESGIKIFGHFSRFCGKNW